MTALLPDLKKADHISTDVSDCHSSRKITRSSLKRILSRPLSMEELDGRLFEANQNHFIFEKEEQTKIIIKSIIDNKNNKGDLMQKKIKRIRFGDVQVHEVEKWKKYNTPPTFCCRWF